MKSMMGYTLIRRLILAAFMAGLSHSALATSAIETTVDHLQTQWAQAQYQTPSSKQKERFAALVKAADTAKSTHPKSAEVLIWSGIIESTYAGVKGGLGALKLAKAARADLEAALRLDPSALAGSAYTSLGTLYYKVPGWPLGFGDDTKAEKLLREALKLSPEGIDSNYFYAEYLREEKHDYAGALTYLQKAAAAPERPGRAVADAGRQQDIATALVEVRKHLP